MGMMAGQQSQRFSNGRHLPMNEQDLATLTAFRHELHRHPELSCQEQQTARRVADMLRGIGVDELHEGIGGHGLVAIIHGEEPGIGVALRADMDALPLQENAGNAHGSQHANVMHACGHDGHAAMLVGAAMELVQQRPQKGHVVLVVQPAEEAGTGAPDMLADGLFERFPVEAIFGMHNWPGVKTGHFVVHDVPHMAASDEFSVTFHSRGGHGAMPHLTRDPILATGLFITGVHQIVGRNISPSDTAVISVGSVHGGDASNIIPAASRVKGDVRSFTLQVRELLEKRIREVAQGAALTAGCEVTLEYTPSTPPVANDLACAALCREIITTEWGSERLVEHPISLSSEDMGFFLEAVPGAYCWIGNGDQPGSPDLHQPDYDFNDASLAPGSHFLACVARRFLKTHS